jgi:MoaA/NifB/PqqE/SkfB family radical SAM enzyme
MIFQKPDIKLFLRRWIEYAQSIYSDMYCLVMIDIFKIYKEDKNDVWIKRLFFEVTNVCNLKCKFCVYSKKIPSKLGIMSFDIFKKAIDEYAELGGGTVCFTPTIGETLLDPGLISKINYAVSLFSIGKIFFYTNGTLFNKDDNYKKIVDSGVHDVKISVGIFDDELYKKIHQTDLYKQMLKGVHKLLKYNREKNEKITIEIHFRSPLLPSETLETPDFIKYIKPYLSKRVNCNFMPSYDNWCGNISKNDLMGVMKMRRVNKFKYSPCVRLRDATVLFDGSVRLCACRVKDTEFDELVVGNIKYDSLKNIFYSEKSKAVRNSFISKNAPPACTGCSVYIPKHYE